MLSKYLAGAILVACAALVSGPGQALALDVSVGQAQTNNGMQGVQPQEDDGAQRQGARVQIPQDMMQNQLNEFREELNEGHSGQSQSPSSERPSNHRHLFGY